MLSSTIDENQLFLHKDAPAVTGVALEKLLNDYNQSQVIKSRLQNKYPSELLDALTFIPKFDAEFHDKAALQAWTDSLQAKLNELAEHLSPKVELIEVTGGDEAGKQQWLPRVTILCIACLSIIH